MSDHNQLGQLSASQLFGIQYGVHDYGDGFWRAMFGPGVGLGASAYYGPYSDGWYNYEGAQYHMRDALCIFKNGLGEEWVGYARDFHLEFNISGLKWKYTGIAKEQGYGY